MCAAGQNVNLRCIMAEKDQFFSRSLQEINGTLLFNDIDVIIVCVYYSARNWCKL